MNIAEYTLEARRFAIYPEQYRISYPALGLIGEIGELVRKLESPNPKEDEVIDEASDILWYAANLMIDMEMTIEMKVVDSTKVTMVGQAMLLAEQVKKVLRDTGVDAEKDRIRRETIKEIVGVIVGLIYTMGDLMGTSLGKIMERNIEKLASRAKRDVLRGDGDTR